MTPLQFVAAWLLLAALGGAIWCMACGGPKS